mmetsp:Transcript_54465/g.127190  ORF Transcript_54465/g.127190 Transcript_54465/m.127190 type:complete len:86 (-) Transcript_54465:536-793(-)
MRSPTEAAKQLGSTKVLLSDFKRAVLTAKATDSPWKLITLPNILDLICISNSGWSGMYNRMPLNQGGIEDILTNSSIMTPFMRML